MRSKTAVILCVLAIASSTACSPDSKTAQLDSPSRNALTSGTPTPFTPSIPATPTPFKSPTSSTPLPTPEKAKNAEAKLFVAGNKNIPVAVTQDDFWKVQDAVFMNDEYDKALALIRQGRIFMVENDTPVVVLEPFGYLTKIKVKKGGRMGWVKSSWIK